MDEPFTMMAKGEAAEIPMIIVSSLFLVTIGDVILDSSIFRSTPIWKFFCRVQCLRRRYSSSTKLPQNHSQ